MAVKQELEVQINAQNNTGRAFTDVQTGANKAFGKGVGGLGALGLTAASAVAAVGTAVLAVGAGLKEASAKAADFEKSMSRVKALSGASETDFKRLTEVAKQLGSTTAFTASQAAEGMSALAMAGFDANQIIATMPGLLDTAAAAQADLGQTADIVSNILSGFGIEAERTGEVADLLTSTFTSSNTSLESLGESMKFVAPVAKSLGQEIDDVAAAVGIMGNAGIQGSMAGTALRTTFLQLASPTGEAAKRVKELGIELTDARGVMLPLPSLIGNVQRGINNLDPSEQTELIKQLVGTEAMSGFQVLLDAGPEKIAQYSDSLKNDLGSAARIAAEQANNLEGSYTKLSSAWDGMMIAIGERLNPTIRALVDDALIPATTVLGEMAKGTDDAEEATGGFWSTLGDFVVGQSPALMLYNSLTGALDRLEEQTGDTAQAQADAVPQLDMFKESTVNIAAAQNATKVAAEKHAKVIREDLLKQYGDAEVAIRGKFIPAIGVATDELKKFEKPAQQAAIDLGEIKGKVEAIEPPPVSAFTDFTQRAVKTLTDPQTGLEASILNVFNSFTSGGAKQAITAAAVAIGNTLAGPIGGAVAAAITRNIDFGRSTREAQGIVGELLRAGSLDFVDQSAVKSLDAFNQSETRDLLQKELGISSRDAGDLASALFLIKSGKSASDLRGGDPGLFDRLNALIRDEVLKRLADDVKRSTEVTAFTDSLRAEAEALAAGEVRPVAGVTTGASSAPPPAASTPAQTGGTASEALAYLSGANASKTISRSRLQQLGFAAVNEALNFFGATGLAKEVFKSIASGASADWHNDARRPEQGGWNIVAAQGFHGVVNKPTTALFGEAGPEYVSITPLNGSSGRGPGGTVHNWNFNITAADPGSMRRYVERDLWPFIQRQMVMAGRSGEGLVPQKAIMAA